MIRAAHRPVPARAAARGRVLRAAEYGAASAATTARTTAVHAIVRAALYLYVISIPFEMPDRTIPVEIPTLAAAILLLTTMVQPAVCYRRIPSALLWFAAWLWVFVAAVWINGMEHIALVVRLFLNMVLLLLVLWVITNLLQDRRVVHGLLLALVAACVLRAGIQLLGIATTIDTLWGGGERVTVLGQNSNLSAMILSAGLVALVGLQATGNPGIPRAGLMTWPLAALLGLAIVQSGSRGGILCAVAGLAVFAFRGRSARMKLRNGLMATAALVLLVWSGYRSQVVRNRFAEAATGQLAGREVIYPALLEMFAERPVLGWGPIANQYEIARRIDEVRRPSRDAHNLALEVLTTTGIIGAIPFFIGIALAVRSAWRARNGPLGAIPLALLAVVFVGTLSGTWIAAKIVWLALSLAVAAGIERQPRIAARSWSG